MKWSDFSDYRKLVVYYVATSRIQNENTSAIFTLSFMLIKSHFSFTLRNFMYGTKYWQYILYISSFLVFEAIIRMENSSSLFKACFKFISERSPNYWIRKYWSDLSPTELSWWKLQTQYRKILIYYSINVWALLEGEVIEGQVKEPLRNKHPNAEECKFLDFMSLEPYSYVLETWWSQKLL